MYLFIQHKLNIGVVSIHTIHLAMLNKINQTKYAFSFQLLSLMLHTDLSYKKYEKSEKHKNICFLNVCCVMML